MIKNPIQLLLLLLGCLAANELFAQSPNETLHQFTSHGNPIITHKYTADPAPM
ncbi:hypothetical protein QWY93_13960 [Echinicola jeungdonensis]|uniref:Uncharacterized protein n=1 Tax=Echinicola jeungdonensis TaxID=709343 RepID=A0ABV5J9H4_9BACT|nr:hypothetical protein [Echinicola jeungdonensis]MDN3670422.1 hypothetical protein [Echinicola jeungdonensis]